MPDVGDRVRFASRKVDEAPREGVVTGVIRQLLRIRWSTGEESTVVPGPGAVAVLSKVKESSSKKATAPAKAAEARQSAKNAKQTAKESTKTSTR